MKKNLFLALALLLSVSIFAQNNSFIINETFDSAEMPEGWYFTGEGADNFKINSTNNAGGDPNELYFKSSPIVTAGIHLVMGSADLTGVDALGLTFKHNLSNAQLSSTIGIATSSDEGATWNTAWSQTFNGAASSGQYNVNETIKPADLGKSNVLFCLFYEGNTYNFNKWYFDDISIFPLSDDIDLQLSSVEVNNTIQAGNIEIGFIASNISGNEVTSFEASYEVEGYDIVTETFNIAIKPNQKQNVKFSKAVELFPGTHEIKVNIISVNGEEDANLDNNSMTKEIRTFMKSIDRTPMIEHFSSSTCTPCVAVDNDMMTLTNTNKGKYTYVKYPAKYPTDIYNTEECVARSNYYLVSGVPNVVLDGVNLGPTSVSQYQFDNSVNTPAFVNIKGAFNINGNNINITTDIMSYVNLNKVKAFITVNEKTTTGNVGDNGETEFHHVMMKMLNDANGNDIEVQLGEHQRLEFSYDMSNTFVEEMNDLEVAVWIQNIVTGEVFNSGFIYEYTQHPYPVRNLEVTNEDNNLQITWDAPEGNNPTGYNIYVNNELVANNTKELSYTTSISSDYYVVEAVALYDNRKSVGVIKSSFPKNEDENGSDTTNLVANYENRFEIYPNPANDILFINAEVEINEVMIYDVYGRLQVTKSPSHQELTSVNVSGLNAGIYIIKIKTNEGNIVKRFIKQ